jgi:hypothetical protein
VTTIKTNQTYQVNSSYGLDNLTSKLEKNQKAVLTRLDNNTYAIKVIKKPNAITGLIAKISGKERKEARSLQDFKSSLVISEAKQLNTKYPNIQKRWDAASREEKINLREELIKYKIESDPKLVKLKVKFIDHPEKLQELASKIRPEVDVDHDFNGTLDIINNHIKALSRSGDL